MKRAQLQIDDKLYEAVRQKAFHDTRSMASVLREALELYMGQKPRPKKSSAWDALPVALGSSHQGPLSPVSENHDQALADALIEDIQTQPDLP